MYLGSIYFYPKNSKELKALILQFLTLYSIKLFLTPLLILCINIQNYYQKQKIISHSYKMKNLLFPHNNFRLPYRVLKVKKTTKIWLL